MTRLLLALLVLSLAAPAAAAAPVVVAACDFTTSVPGGGERARAIGTLVITRLAQRPGIRVVGSDQLQAALRHGAERELAGVSETALQGIASALDAAVVVHGAVERFGARVVLSAAAIDPRTADALGRYRVDAASEGDVPAAADRLGDKIAQALGLPPATEDAELVSGTQIIGGPKVLLNLKLGSTLAGLQGFSVDKFSLRFDFEGDVVLRSWLLGYLEVGVMIGRAKDDATQAEGTFSLVPAGAGLKVLFRPEKALRPFVGLGFGLAWFAALLDTQQEFVFRGDLTTGVHWMPWERVGVVAELRAGLDTRLTYGFSADFGVTLAF